MIKSIVTRVEMFSLHVFSLAGSWFIQALCDILSRIDLLRQYDLLSLLTLVNKRVAFNFESSVPGNSDMDQRKQVHFCSFLSTHLCLTNIDKSI